MRESQRKRPDERSDEATSPEEGERGRAGISQRHDDEAVDIAVEDSFPASDPPSSTSSTTGAPVREPAQTARRRGPEEQTEPDDEETREREERDTDVAPSHPRR
jgi:hypothetical protein